ncbi:MAG: hypothetical protein ACE37E_11185 [Hyphomicrobiales bacterium]
MIYDNLYYLDDDLKDKKYSIIRGAEMADIDEISKALAEDPQCINDTDPATGLTALLISCCDRNHSIIDFLIQQPGINISQRDVFHRDAITVAHIWGDYEMYEKLCIAMDLTSAPRSPAETIISFPDLRP